MSESDREIIAGLNGTLDLLIDQARELKIPDEVERFRCAARELILGYDSDVVFMASMLALALLRLADLADEHVE